MPNITTGLTPCARARILSNALGLIDPATKAPLATAEYRIPDSSETITVSRGSEGEFVVSLVLGDGIVVSAERYFFRYGATGESLDSGSTASITGADRFFAFLRTENLVKEPFTVYQGRIFNGEVTYRQTPVGNGRGELSLTLHEHSDFLLIPYTEYGTLDGYQITMSQAQKDVLSKEGSVTVSTGQLGLDVLPQGIVGECGLVSSVAVWRHRPGRGFDLSYIKRE